MVCLQGSAVFWASRGFAAFNINYRLAGDKGLLPSPPSPPPGPQPGTRLVSFLSRCGQTYWPHPSSQKHNATPYEGPLRFGAADGALCMSAAAASSQVTLEVCSGGSGGSQQQQWRLATFSTSLQRVVHIATGQCLDIAGADPAAPRANLPIVIALCDAGGVQTTWQLGTTGALITLHAALSVATAPASSAASSNASSSDSATSWYPAWESAYPAVRDLKAAVRFVRANAGRFGVDAGRIVVSGGSAGSTNSLAAGVSFPGDYFHEISGEVDPTLATTNPNTSSVVQAVFGHWSSDGEDLLIQQHDPLNRTRYTAANAPVIEFHGNNDTTIPFAAALAVQAEFKRTGVPYELHVLEGCGHGAWCYNGRGNCDTGCPNGANGTAGYDPTVDDIALPFLARVLNLTVL